MPNRTIYVADADLPIFEKATDYEYRLEVYDTLNELKDNVPQELYEAVAQALKGEPDGVEFLDI